MPRTFLDRGRSLAGHEFDLLGRVFERDAALGIKRRIVRLPMIAEDDDPLGRRPGERLWPEWFRL
jgi:hypothetical protein